MTEPTKDTPKEPVPPVKAESTPKAGTTPYRLKADRRHHLPTGPVTGGTIVDLTPSQAKAWADKFEPVK